MNQNILKIIIIITQFYFISLLTIIMKTPLAREYELSIYDAYPWYFWLLIILGVISGICIIIYSSFNDDKLWIVGIYIVIFTNLVIILLPIFRGYFINSPQDEITHLGFIKDIFSTGHVGNSNYYPISHILASEIAYIIDVIPITIVKIIPSIFYILYYSNLYFLSRVSKIGIRPSIFVMAFGSVLLYSYYNYLFMPTQFALYIVPFILFIGQKKEISFNKSEYKILYIILLILIPFLHPLGAIYTVGILLIYEISKKIYSYFTKFDQKIELAPSLIVLITFIMWFSYFLLFMNTVRKAVGGIIYGIGSPEIDTISSKLHKTEFNMFDIFNLFIRNYGHELLYSILALFAIALIARKIRDRKNTLRIADFFLPILFVTFLTIYISALLTDFTPVTGTSNRLLYWAIFVSVIMNGYIFHEYISTLRDNRIIYVSILTIIIAISAIIGVFSTYPSPYIQQPNIQVTKIDWNSMEWFYKHKIISNNIYISQLSYRAPDFIFGYDMEKPESIKFPSYTYPHFGYDINKTLAYPYRLDAYLIILKRDIVVYSKLWPKVGIINHTDFNMLNRDPKVGKIYYNGGTEIWYQKYKVK